jgi:TatD DNase family protein
MGFYFGINGVITFKSAKIKEIYKDIPLENIVLETDSPYLSPEPVRGTQNNSANINYIAEFVANIYGISLDELSSVTNHNAKKIFTKIER